MLMLSFKYMVSYYSSISCYFKGIVMTKTMIINSLVTIYSCIYLFRIFIQNSRNIFLRWKSLSLDEREKVIQFVKKTILKSGHRFTTLQSLEKSTQLKKKKIPSLPICTYSFFCLCLFHTSILDNWATAWILSIIHGSNILLQITLAVISIVFL